MATSQMNDIIAASGHAEKKAARLSLGMYLVYFLLLVAVKDLTYTCKVWKLLPKSLKGSAILPPG